MNTPVFTNMDLSKRLIKDLIGMYKERDYLWRVKSEDYRKKDLRMNGYQEIVDYLKSQGISEATDSLVRDKIQNMRRSVRKEKSRIERCKGYTTNLWYYDLLKSVIEQGGRMRGPKSKSKVIKQETVLSDTDNSSSDPVYERPLRIGNETPTEQLENTEAQNETEQTYVRNPDEFEALGISIAAKVRRMDSTQKIYAELLIQKVLARGLLGTLNNNTDLLDVSNAKRKLLLNEIADPSYPDKDYEDSGVWATKGHDCDEGREELRQGRLAGRTEKWRSGRPKATSIFKEDYEGIY